MSGGLFALMSKKNREDRRRVKELREAFEAADKDKDGALSEEEWFEVLRASGANISREEITIMFHEKDRDNDGQLSFDEFMGYETRIEKAFKAMDKDGDGFVSKSEFKQVCKNLTTEQVEAAFNKFDKSGNGKLDYKEFCGMMNARKRITNTSASSSSSATPSSSSSRNRNK